MRIAAIVMAGLLVAGCSPGASNHLKPNVVIVVIDTLRADHLPFYGYRRQTAPFLDSLASRGVVFERAWSTSSWTAPSTASIFTGLYPNQHGVTQGMKLVEDVQRDQQPTLTLNRIPGAIETLPEFMQSRGYRTFGITDNPNICAEEGFDSGFDRFKNFDDRNAPAVNRALAGWIEEIRGDAPWFVYLHYMDPHYPYVPRAPWFEDPLQNTGVTSSSASREQVVSQLLATYDSEINYVDEFIRRAFVKLGVDEDTVVILVADHGEELMQRSEDLQHKFKLYSELTHVPLVIIHPGSERLHERVPHNVSIIDILPTLRQIIGAPASPVDAGRSLVPYYAELERPEDTRPVFSMRERLEVLGGQKKWAVVLHDDKLIVTENESGSRFELYDLDLDWGELRDLATARGERVAELRGGLKQMRAEARRFDPERVKLQLTEEQALKLQELGYGGDAPEDSGK